MSAIHDKVRDSGRCRVCGVPDTIHALDPAHVIPKSLGGRNNYESVIAMCRACHDAQHRKEFELLPHLTRAEEAEAVWAVGLGKAYRYLTNGGSRCRNPSEPFYWDADRIGEPCPNACHTFYDDDGEDVPYPHEFYVQVDSAPPSEQPREGTQERYPQERQQRREPPPMPETARVEPQEGNR